jgi:15,16-dihydrobiliverdin:ferredoxin oxidoreductase
MNTLLSSLSIWLVSFSSHVHLPGNNGISFGHALSLLGSNNHIRRSNTNSPSPPPHQGNFLKMDSGEESLFMRPLSNPLTHTNSLQSSFISWNRQDSSHHNTLQRQQQNPQQHHHILRTSQEKIGMPWIDSIVPTQDLTFMPFWNHQISFMEHRLKDLQSSPTTNKDGTRDFSLAKGHDVRVANLSFSSSHFRKIRLTYYDAGPQGQVFNSLWYPSLEYDLPVLGIDLLQFHAGKKHLTVIDFQPIHEHDFRHSSSSWSSDQDDHVLANIRNQFPILQGKMSSRFYDESQFFSQHMLFARFTDPNVVKEDLWSAFQQCLSAYVTMVHNSTPKPEQAKYVLDRQKAYDVYSANRDPAHAMFKAKFGESWADDYVYEFLFDLSREELSL